MCPQSVDLQQAMTAAVSERIKYLLKAEKSELESLPEQSSEEVTTNGMQFTLSVWHDKPSDSEHRIVVQAYKRKLMGIAGKVYAEGFILNDKDDRLQMSSDELAEFI